MVKSHLRAILCAINSAQETVGTLACENYPFTPFCDDDFREMFYQLNDMSLKIHEKIEQASKEQAAQLG